MHRDLIGSDRTGLHCIGLHGHGEQLVPNYRTMPRPASLMSTGFGRLNTADSTAMASYSYSSPASERDFHQALPGPKRSFAVTGLARGFTSGRLQQGLDRTSDDARRRQLCDVAEDAFAFGALLLGETSS